MPPFVEALQSGHYHIKWTTCSDLPTPMYDAYVAMSNGTIYCTGSCPNEDNEQIVCSYDTKTDQWKWLPRPGHRLGVIHMVDDKLTIFGGRDPTTDEFLNTVTTYNSKTDSWSSYYPDMLHSRHKPGVVTVHEHAIVMGGKSSQDAFHDSIEVMNYHLHPLQQWKEISVCLPDTMWALRPTVSGDHLTIVGYNGDEGTYATHCRISLEEIIPGCLPATHQGHSTSDVSAGWKKLSPSSYYDTVTLPNSFPPIIIGGGDDNFAPTSDINLFDVSKNTWRKVGSLTSARDSVGVASLNSNSIIVIGGASGGVGIEGAKKTCLATVEVGNVISNKQ